MLIHIYIKVNRLLTPVKKKGKAENVKRNKNKKKSRKCNKQGIKIFLLLYYIQAKCGDIADKNPNAADDDEQTFNYRWPKFVSTEYLFQLTYFMSTSYIELE